MRHDGVLAALGQDHEVVVDHAPAILGEPVTQGRSIDVLGQVVDRREHVARPALRQGQNPLGDVGVAADRHARLTERQHLEHGVTSSAQNRRVLRVHVGAAVAQDGHADDLAVVVEDRDLPGILRVPEDVIRVGARTDVLRDEVRAPANSGRVNHVRNGVLPFEVVPGVLELLPDIRDVGDVVVVQGTDEVAVHQAPHVVV